MTNCSRAHGEQELRRLDQFYKKKLCKYWAEQGSCIRGSDCYFGKIKKTRRTVFNGDSPESECRIVTQ